MKKEGNLDQERKSAIEKGIEKVGIERIGIEKIEKGKEIRIGKRVALEVEIERREEDRHLLQRKDMVEVENIHQEKMIINLIKNIGVIINHILKANKSQHLKDHKYLSITTKLITLMIILLLL